MINRATSRKAVSRVALLTLCLGILLPGAHDGSHSSATAQTRAPYKILNVPYEIVEADLSPFGGYLLLGRKPRGFADFYNLTLELAEPPVKDSELKVVGGIVTTPVTSSERPTSTVFQIAEMRMTPTTLAFTTETVGDTNYNFDGRFLKGGALSRFMRTRVAVLEGTMTKRVGGAPRAESRMRFRFKVWKAPYYVPPTKS